MNLNKRVKNLDITDLSLTKLSAGCGFLVIAKLWTPLLSLEWYWYVILALVFGIRPLYRFFIKK